MSKSNNGPTRPWWKTALKWAGIVVGGLVVLYGGWRVYDLITDYKPTSKTVKAVRPELGQVKLDPQVSKSGIPGWVARFHLDVSADHAWKSLNSCSNLAKAIKGISHCIQLKKGDNWELSKMILTHPDGAYMKTKTHYDSKRMRSHWKMVDGSFQAAEGFVRLQPLPGHPGWCQVEYGYFLKISIMLTKKFERPRVRRSVRRMAHEIQRYFTKNPDKLKKAQRKKARPAAMKPAMSR